MDTLPYDALNEIATYLPFKDLIAFIRTCKRTNELKGETKRFVKHIKHSKEICPKDYKEGYAIKKTQHKHINNLRISAVASYYNLLDVMKYLHEHRKPISSRCVPLAASKGNFGIIEYLIENASNEIDRDSVNEAMNEASDKGYLDIVKFLHVKGYECTQFAMNRAAENGFLDVVKFLHENRMEGCNELAMNKAAINGHYEIVKYLAENRTEGNAKYAFINAAHGGHLKILKYIHTKYNTNIFCVPSIRYLKPEIIEYLMQNDLNGPDVDFFSILKTTNDPLISEVIENNLMDYTKRAIEQSKARRQYQSTKESSNSYSSDESDE